MRPQLLVSVRSADEAQAALAGGADIIDVKEPSRGSLGMADAATIASVLDAVRSAADGGDRTAQGVGPIAVSAAFGEAIEWLRPTEDDSLPGLVHRSAPRPKSLSGLAYAKLGPAGLASRDWSGQWAEARLRIEQRFQPQQWIAVAYADWRDVSAPAPEAVIDEARRLRCAGVLLDTKRKDGRTLLDYLPPAQLVHLCKRARRHTLPTALAGRVTIELLPELVQVGADVIAVRSAACTGNDRLGNVSTAAVGRFKSALRRFSVHATNRMAARRLQAACRDRRAN